MPRVPDRHLSRATVRFYAELNDFLPADCRQRDFEARFFGRPAVKDLIESLGVPHTEVDHIQVNGAPAGFDHRVGDGDRISVYPVFERFDIAGTSRINRAPLREPRFICDVHLGRLARDLRLLGFDTVYANDLDDDTIRARAASEHRVILTRDLGILRHASVTHGYFVRATDPLEQIRETVDALQLGAAVQPWRRCMMCNGTLEAVAKDTIQGEIPDTVWSAHNDFLRCASCSRIYWKGSHYDRMRERLASAGIEI